MRITAHSSNTVHFPITDKALFIYIFSFLQPADVVCARLTCKWWSIDLKSSDLWQIFILRYFSKAKEQQVFKNLDLFFTYHTLVKMDKLTKEKFTFETFSKVQRPFKTCYIDHSFTSILICDQGAFFGSGQGECTASFNKNAPVKRKLHDAAITGLWETAGFIVTFSENGVYKVWKGQIENPVYEARINKELISSEQISSHRCAIQYPYLFSIYNFTFLFKWNMTSSSFQIENEIDTQKKFNFFALELENNSLFLGGESKIPYPNNTNNLFELNIETLQYKRISKTGLQKITAFIKMPPFLIVGGDGGIVQLWGLDNPTCYKRLKILDLDVISFHFYRFSQSEISLPEIFQSAIVVNLGKSVCLWHPLFFKGNYFHNGENGPIEKVMIRKTKFYISVANILVKVGICKETKIENCDAILHAKSCRSFYKN